MPLYDTQGKIQTFVPGLQSTQFPLAPAGLVFPGDPGIPKTLAPTHYNNVGPRLGLAYSPNFSDGILGKIFGGPGKSSIRASYGLYYTSIEDLNLFYEVADAPFGLYWTSPLSVLNSTSRSRFAPPARLSDSASPSPHRLRVPLPTRHLTSRSTSRSTSSPATTSTTSCRTPSTSIFPSNANSRSRQYSRWLMSAPRVIASLRKTTPILAPPLSVSN